MKDVSKLKTEIVKLKANTTANNKNTTANAKSQQTTINKLQNELINIAKMNNPKPKTKKNESPTK